MKDYENNPEFQKFVHAQKFAPPVADIYEEANFGNEEWSQNGTAIRQFIGFFFPFLGVAFFCFGMSVESNKSKAWRVLGATFCGLCIASTALFALTYWGDYWSR